MTAPAPPGGSEAPRAGESPGAIASLGALRGLVVFLMTAAIGQAVGMAEYLATGGLYRLWTWIKVGFLYVLLFCGVGVRASFGAIPLGSGGDVTHQLRVPLLLGTAVLVWQLYRAGAACGKRARGAGAAAAGAVGVALGFALPVFAASLLVRLQFLEFGNVVVAPIRWEAGALPLGIAVLSAGTGIAMARAQKDPIGPGAWVRAWLEGGWRMFGWALLLAFVGFLVLAAAKPEQTGLYARAAGDAGRTGAVLVGHHVLLLPDQSIWLLAPAMGGSTEISLGEGDRSRITLPGADIDPGASLLLSLPFGTERVLLGGGFYLFLLVPLAATVLGGRQAARARGSLGGQVIAAAGAGGVFAVLVTLGALLSRATLPLPVPFVLASLSIHAAMPSTALLALAWGVAGGLLGALTVRERGRQEPVDPG